ncbi:hypothetical protein BFW38_07355 [Terasakiispira papahanaumokuakeensis]|uniref:Uncharacterized protein n=1 Tax=Terasakiispira papahanaumokuakeensis TaxID=197479 RepID=A0A1E2V902_9GAMM|nr:hypothetical protein BFW38_07355 [Terasakiispira papahanaumokuakeensis]
MAEFCLRGPFLREPCPRPDERVALKCLEDVLMHRFQGPDHSLQDAKDGNAANAKLQAQCHARNLYNEWPQPHIESSWGGSGTWVQALG